MAMIPLDRLRDAGKKRVPTYTKGIDAGVAAVITLGTFPTSLDEARLQRVADLMLEQGFLKSKIEAKSLLIGNK